MWGNVLEQAPDLRTRQILTLEFGIKHEVKAREDSAFLVTILWPAADVGPGGPNTGEGLRGDSSDSV